MHGPEPHIHARRDASAQEFMRIIDIIVGDTGSQPDGQVMLAGKQVNRCRTMASLSAPMVSGLPTGVVTGSLLL
jgi:hypothetical protein